MSEIVTVFMLFVAVGLGFLFGPIILGLIVLSCWPIIRFFRQRDEDYHGEKY